MINSSIDQKTKKYIDRLLESKSRPSSFVFSGTDESSNEEAGFYFISKMSGKLDDVEFIEKIRTKNHPDVVIIEPEIEEKKGKKREKEINIGQIREALERLRFFPYELSKKYCLIKRAQKMNPEASNALLKSLEEPSERGIFILFSNDVESILTTIISRCAILRLPQRELPKWNEENRTNFRNIFNEEIFERFDYVEKISKNKNDTITVLTDWELVMAEGLRKLAGSGESENNRAKIRKVVELLEKTRGAINKLESTNANARAVGEELVLAL